MDLPTRSKTATADREPVSKFVQPFAIRVRGVGKCYQSYGKQLFWALRDVSLDVAPGQALAVLGRNGSGKSTLLQIVAGTLAPSAGELEVTGRSAALLELGSGFNPELTGRQNVFVMGAMLGMTRRALAELCPAIVDFADIGDYIEQPVKRYSSGMFVRLAFAVQAILDPDVFIIDEALAVGDLGFQRKCFRLLEARLAQGRAALVASHDLGLVRRVCGRAIVLEEGRVVVDDVASVAIQRYLSEFAVADSHGSIDPSGTVLPAIVPSSEHRPSSAGLAIVGIAVQDSSGRPSHAFQHGQRMVVGTLFESSYTEGAVACEVRIADMAGHLIWSSGIDSTGVIRVTPGRSYVDQLDVTLNLGPGRYLLSSALWVTDSFGVTLLSECDQFTNGVGIEVHDFELDDDEPVPFWGVTRLPYTVRPLVRVGE